MSYLPPVPIVEWAPTVWPGSSAWGGITPIGRTFLNLTNAVWQKFPSMADGSSRLISFSDDKGRRAVTENFGAGTMTLVFDNSDSALDPIVSGSVTSGKDAGVPFRLKMRNPATGVTSYIFSGVIDSAWMPSWGRGQERTATVTVTDWYGYSARMPAPYCAALFGSPMWDGATTYPLLWWRGPMNASLATSAVNATVWDFGTGGHDGRVGSGTIGPADPLGTCDTPSIAMGGGALIYCPTTFTPGDPNRIHFGITANVLSHPSGGINLLGCRDAATGNAKWMLTMTLGGGLTITVFDASGSPLTFVGVSYDFTAYGAFCVAGEINYATKTVTIRTTGTTSSATWTGTAASPAGRIVIESDATIGHYWSDARVGSPDGAAVMLPGQPGQDLVATSLQLGHATAPFLMDCPPFWARPSDFPTLSSTVDTYSPQQSFFDAIANAMGGALWCQRDGWLHWRGGHDLGYYPGSRPPLTAHTDGIYEVVARLTDQPTPGNYIGAVTGASYNLPIVRYSGSGHGGLDPQRVINWSNVGGATFIDLASYKRYGAQKRDLPGVGTVAASGSPAAAAAADQIASRKSPTTVLNDIVITPYGDPVATKFVLQDLELEARVLVTQSDQVTGTPILEDEPMRVQHESWSWANGGADWTVTLHVDQPIPNA